MVADWIYNNPIWLWGTVLVGLAAGIGGLGLLAVHRLVHIEVRRAHNQLVGFLVAVISVTWAVLLAFIAVATWESYSHAQDIVDVKRTTWAASIATRRDCLQKWANRSVTTCNNTSLPSSTRNGRCNAKGRLLTRAGSRCANCTPPS
ncbi:MAG TPA: hypothetical protein VKB29_03810 [Candidatus Binataceae bacterium]|nr:hypothetical protein [Candidatus Binataceae bacterium]